MYTFVLEWTPALTRAAEAAAAEDPAHRGVIPHGYIFAGFMVAIMIGASAFKLLEKVAKPESFLRLPDSPTLRPAHPGTGIEEGEDAGWCWA